MEKKTVRGIFDNGELRFAEPVDMEGCWKLEITFLEREDEDVHLDADPHRPEKLLTPLAMEELHRTLMDQKPPTTPF